MGGRAARPRRARWSASSPRCTATHERMLAEAGARDAGDLIRDALRLVARAAIGRGPVRARAGRRWPGARPRGGAWSARSRSAARWRLPATRRSGATVPRCGRGADAELDGLRARASSVARQASLPSRRSRSTARVVPARPVEPRGEIGGEVEFWRCANERAQAQSVAADVERLIAREGVSRRGRSRCWSRPRRARVRRLRSRWRSEPSPHRLVGEAAFFQRAEIRDLLAWLRLLADPSDAGAVVRALARAADRAALGRHRPLHPDRAAAQARHGRRARRRDRVAAGPARGARADPRVPEALPRRLSRRSTRPGRTCTCTG